MKLLIANRGEIASRIIRTARTMGIRTVAVYSDLDRHRLYVEQADEAVALGGSDSWQPYVDIDRMLDTARRTGADAVHPGYGLLAEHAGFARACGNAGLIFVGPLPTVIAAMADKMRARHLMQDAGLPVLPGGTDPARVGFPLIVKAACGGGGKGIRVVDSPADLERAAAAAREEAAEAFGDHRVFFEQYLHPARHVEVQIFADAYGRVLHLGERECSIQRRHQKVIEETPSPAVDADLRKALCAAAITAAKALGYANAGTVEFLLDPSGAFYFLEMNTRLQVEHPVTELAWRHSGPAGPEPLDLVRLQLLVALGEPLPLTQGDVTLDGHAIEARLYAEDPGRGFQPVTGQLTVWEPAGDVRVDSGMRAGDKVSGQFDGLLAKLIAAGPTRREAAARLATALRASRLHGITTNRDLLVRTLESRAFLAGDLSTTFLADQGIAALPADPDAGLLHLAAAALTAAAPGVSAAQPITYDGTVVVCTPVRDGRWTVRIAANDHEARVYAWPDERPDRAIDLELDGRRTHVTVRRAGDHVYVDSPLGHVALRLTAPSSWSG